jgi:hypothetical protein
MVQWSGTARRSGFKIAVGGVATRTDGVSSGGYRRGTDGAAGTVAASGLRLKSLTRLRAGRIRR